MNMSDYLLFSLNSVRYGVDASAVREIFWLPELSLIEEAPPYIAGVINLRGQILPVMSLDERFQRLQNPALLTDRIIVLQANDIKIGIMVSDVHDVMPISPSDIEPMPRFNRHDDTIKHFIAGEAKVNDTFWMLLDLGMLIDAPDLAHKIHEELASIDLFQQLPEAERNIFQTRAKQLAQTGGNDTATDQQAFAVIQLGQEFYAIAISEVREFCHLGQFTSIPCCPNHIMGNMNLRGDILTLIDVRPVLTLSLDDSLTEVMVVESEGLRVGVPITKVLDVIYVAPTDHLPLPAYANEVNLDHCTSAIPYHEHIASLLDIKTLLTKGGLEVNENV